MPAELLVIGLDAAESTLLQQWAAAGRLPHLARLGATGRSVGLRNEMEFFPGTIWPNLQTGRSVQRDGLFCHVAQLCSGDARIRALRPDDIDMSRTWFNIAASAGRKVLVIDPVQALAEVGPHGMSVDQWMIHDAHWDHRCSDPTMAEIVGRHGAGAPRPDCDSFHQQTAEGYDRLLDALCATMQAKQSLTLELLERDWDAVFVTFSEAHCAGHQYWHFFDPGSPFHDPDASPRLQAGVETIYTRLDAMVGELVSAVGADATVAVVASHGMEVEVGGPAVIQEAVKSLGYGSQEPPALGLRGRIPGPVRRFARALLPSRAASAINLDARDFERSSATAIAVPNNRCGAVRLRVRGRDPGEGIEPRDLHAVIGDLRQQLGQLRRVENDEPIIAAMATPAEVFDAEAHPDLPDLMIDFRRDIGPLDRVYSARTGTIEVPLRWEWLPRTGDHTEHTTVWLSGPRTEKLDLADAAAVDLAPTLLDLLGVEVPEGMDGRSLVVGGDPGSAGVRVESCE